MPKKDKNNKKLNNKILNKKSNAISSKILSSLPQEEPTALLSVDEIEKCLPKADAQTVTIQKEKEAKDYTVIRQETGKLNELIRYKLQYDLLIWQVFYEKCHEVEDSFFIQDDNLDKMNKSNATKEDITVRDIKFRRQNKTYSDLLIEEYNQKRYQEYVRSITGEDQEVEEVIKKYRFSYLIICLILLGLGAGNLFVNYDKFNFDLLKPLVTTVFLVFALIFLALFTFSKKVYKIKKYQAKVRPHMNYEEWKEKNCVSDEYNSRIALIKKNYVEVLKHEEENLNKKIEAMKLIKQKMQEVIPLYKDFYSEDQVNYLLNTVLDRKCDTIRKAVKLAKEKEYQVPYLSTLARLTKSFNYPETFKAYIQEYNNLPIDKKTEFDNAIEKNNQILRYLNRIHLSTVKIDNDPFISDK